MKKNIIIQLLILSFIVVNKLEAQEIRINNGIAFTSISNSKINMLEDKIQTYAIFIGVDYFKHSFYELSSEIGYITKGGKEEWFDNMNYVNVKINEKFNYLNVNTTFRIIYRKSNYNVYAGIGPKVDFLVSDDKFQDPIYRDYEISKVNFGAKSEIGFKLNVYEVLNVGMNCSYLFDFNKFGKSDYSSLKNNALIVSISVGYEF